MSGTVACSRCGETEDLTGERTATGIRISCGRCGAGWMRDTAPRCASCGGTSIVSRPRALTQYSRGTQLSIVGWQNVPCCTACDAAALTRSTFSNGPLPAGYRPAAMGRDQPDQPEPDQQEPDQQEPDQQEPDQQEPDQPHQPD